MNVATSAPGIVTIADLLERLGGISASRVRMKPPPGTAIEQDVLDVHSREKRLCELVDGVLVEKAMGYAESRLAAVLIHVLEGFLDQHDLGIVAGADGMMRLVSGLVRYPDVSFVAWARLPGRKLPREPIPELVPDLAIEVLSEGNTKGEMERKVREYFASGARLVWLIDPRTRTAEIFASPDRSHRIGVEESLSGADVLPGFSVRLGELFDRAARVQRG